MELRDQRGVRTAREAPEEELARLSPEELVERLRAIRAVTDVALAHLKLEPLLEELVERIRTALAVDTVTVLLRSDDGASLDVRASLGLEEVGPRTASIPLGAGLVGAVAHQREPVIVDDPPAVEVAIPALRRLGSMMVVPLLADGDLFGVLHVGSFAPRHFSEAELATLQVVGERVALALERARLYRLALEEGRERAAAEGAAGLRAKSDFLAVMSHELRTPLAAVMGYAELLRLGIPVEIPPEAITQVERIEHSARHLLQLIEEILSFSRAETGREHLHLAPADLRKTVAEAAELVEPVATRKGLAVRVDLPESPVVVRTDAEKVRQILSHLLSNAVKFTHEGEVGVRLETLEREVVVQVRDTGVGIAPEHRARVFDPFWQVDQGSTREAEGMGLGLAIAWRLAGLVGGSLALETEAGSGTTFTLRVPRE